MLEGSRMRRLPHRSAAVLVMLALLCGGGCGRVKKLFAPPESGSKPAPPAVPALKILGVPREDQVALRDVLQVRGLLRQADYYVVMINTQLVRKGEALVMTVGNKTYTLEILSVDEKRVIVRAVGKPVVAATPNATNAPALSDRSADTSDK